MVQAAQNDLAQNIILHHMQNVGEQDRALLQPGQQIVINIVTFINQTNFIVGVAAFQHEMEGFGARLSAAVVAPTANAGRIYPIQDVALKTLRIVTEVRPQQEVQEIAQFIEEEGIAIEPGQVYHPSHEESLQFAAQAFEIEEVAQ